MISRSREYLNGLNFDEDDQIICSESIKINGLEFRLGLYVCLEVPRVRDDNMPLFGLIK